MLHIRHHKIATSDRDNVIAEELKINVEQKKRLLVTSPRSVLRCRALTASPYLVPERSIQFKGRKVQKLVSRDHIYRHYCEQKSCMKIGGSHLNIVATSDLPCHVLYVDAEKNVQHDYPTSIQSLNKTYDTSQYNFEPIYASSDR